jgi:hypothetical protein
VLVLCSALAAGAMNSLGPDEASPGFGYLQLVPLCLVSRQFARRTSGKAGPDFDLNPNLLGYLYVPYGCVVGVNIIGLVFIWKRFSSKDSQSNASSLARLRVLRTIKQYLSYYLVYTLLLFTAYIIPIRVHTCTSTYKYSDMSEYLNSEKDDDAILQFPPACVSWRGYACDSTEKPSENYYAVQKIFFALFCLRGVPDLLVFLHLNIGRIIDVIRDREYRTTSLRSTSTMSQPLNDEHGVQSLNIAHRFREDIMAFTQVRAPPPHDSAPALPCSRRNTT